MIIDVFIIRFNPNDNLSLWDRVIRDPLAGMPRNFVAPQSLPEARLLAYEGIFLVWLQERGDFVLRAASLGGLLGALSVFASKRFRSKPAECDPRAR